MEGKSEIIINGIYSAVGNLNTFMLVSGGLLLLIVGTKFFSPDKKVFKVPKLDIEIPWKKIWIILAGYTIAHFYFALILNQRIDKLQAGNTDLNQKATVWQKVTDGSEGGFIFAGMQKRLNTHKKTFLGIDIYTMQKTDTTTWISLGMSILLFLSIFQLSPSKKELAFSAYSALMICIINWVIGGWWAINISNLAP